MAQIKEIHPKIIMYHYTQEKEDKDYGICLWADIIINLDSWEISITSDRGNFAHRWPIETHRTFRKFLSSCDEHYLLRKFCGRPNVFNYQKTKENLYLMYHTEENITEYLNTIFQDIENDCCDNSPELFIKSFEEHDTENYFSDIWEFPVYDYPYDAICITRILTKEILPLLKN